MSRTDSNRCLILFKMARRHGWGNPISAEGIVDLALESSEQGVGRELVEELRSKPYIGYQRGQGYWLKNDPDSQAMVAFLLTERCEYTELQIEATLSRFQQAGGFEEYDDSVLDVLDDW